MAGSFLLSWLLSDVYHPSVRHVQGTNIVLVSGRVYCWLANDLNLLKERSGRGWVEGSGGSSCLDSEGTNVELSK